MKSITALGLFLIVGTFGTSSSLWGQSILCNMSTSSRDPVHHPLPGGRRGATALLLRRQLWRDIRLSVLRIKRARHLLDWPKGMVSMYCTPQYRYQTHDIVCLPQGTQESFTSGSRHLEGPMEHPYDEGANAARGIWRGLLPPLCEYL